MLEFLAPVEHFGVRFDRAMTLFEFSALREPEATQFPAIGAWLRAKGVEFREVPTPSMLFRGALVPDLYIANQLEGVPANFYVSQYVAPPEIPKSDWRDVMTLEPVSIWQHGAKFHDEFIEPMCRKISGRSSAEIVAKFHRALWLPIFHAPTLRARQSIPTPFWYPTAGYAGAAVNGISGDHGASARPDAQGNGRKNNQDSEAAELQIAYVLGAPLQTFSVCFVVDESPIYRVTDMDVCAGIEAPTHRLIVEYRGECDIWNEVQRLGLADAKQVAYGSARLQLPTLANVAAGWTPRPHINAQLWSIINAET